MHASAYIILIAIFVLLLTILIIIFTANAEMIVSYKYNKDNNVLNYALKVAGITIKKHETNFKTPATRSKKKRFQVISGSAWRAIEIDNVSSELSVRIVEGTGDAAKTALLYGVLYFLVETVKVFIAANTDLYKENIQVDCDFNNKIFSVDIFCIFKLKLVNAIFEVLKLYKLNKNDDKVGDINV